VNYARDISENARRDVSINKATGEITHTGRLAWLPFIGIPGYYATRARNEEAKLQDRGAHRHARIASIANYRAGERERQGQAEVRDQVDVTCIRIFESRSVV